MIRNILPVGVECIFVRQPKQLGLGHAVLCAERAVGNEPFAVLLADDFLAYDGAGVTADLIGAYNKSGKTQMSVMQVDGPDISKYGVVNLNKNTGSVEGLVEKPNYKDAPSNTASIGRYILTPDIFEILKEIKPNKGGEIQITDALLTQAKQGKVIACKFKGRRFDCGSVEGFLEANNHFAKKLEFNKA